MDDFDFIREEYGEVGVQAAADHRKENPDATEMELSSVAVTAWYKATNRLIDHRSKCDCGDF